MPYFVEFLKTAGLFDDWVADCPLDDHSSLEHGLFVRAQVDILATMEVLPEEVLDFDLRVAQKYLRRNVSISSR